MRLEPERGDGPLLLRSHVNAVLRNHQRLAEDQLLDPSVAERFAAMGKLAAVKLIMADIEKLFLVEIPETPLPLTIMVDNVEYYPGAQA